MDDYAAIQPTEFGASDTGSDTVDTALDEGLGPPFSALVVTTHGVPVVEVRGEVDLATVPRLLEAVGIAGSRLDGRPLLVVDLRNTEFIDVYGVRVLVEEALAMQGLGGELRVVVPDIGSIARLFGLLGVERLLELRHDLDLEPSTESTGSTESGSSE